MNVTEEIDDIESEDKHEQISFDPSRLPINYVAGLGPEARQLIGLPPKAGDAKEVDGGDFDIFAAFPTRDTHDVPAASVAGTVESRNAGIALTHNDEGRLVPTFADFAKDYLKARRYEVNGDYLLRKHRGEWLRYNGTCYESLSEEELRADIMNYFIETPLRSRVNKSFVSGILDHLTARCLVPATISLPARQTKTEWEEEHGTVTLQNGLIDLNKLQFNLVPLLQQHTPRFVSRCVLPYDYDPDAQCPTWMRFIEEVQPDEACRRLLQQIFGYCLTFDMKYQKFFMFEGTGGNGKSVTTSILRRLVGTSNTSALPLKGFHDKHGLVSTYGKLVNFVGELKEKDADAESLLKQATGGDSMHFEAKYQKAFSAPFTAKIIICTNERPAFTDRSNGLWRRLIILPFPNSISPERQDPELEQKLGTELPGILNWAIQGALDLNKTRDFEKPQASTEASESFREQANPEQAFFKEYCRMSPDAAIGTQELYDNYRRFTDNMGHMPLSGTKFQAEVLKLPDVKKERPHTNGQRINMYRGITVGVAPLYQDDHQQQQRVLVN